MEKIWGIYGIIRYWGRYCSLWWKTGTALNTEILEKENYKQYLKDEYEIDDISTLKPRKAVELGHIFQLGKSYSETMKANYMDSDGKEKPFIWAVME